MPVKKVLIMRSKDRKDTAGRQRSLGFGFVEFRNHKDALATLRATNNNPGIFSADRRPIVEFAVENSVVIKAKKRREEKIHHRQRQGEGHAPIEKTKTNKEIRLEKKQKRKEARQRKREAKKKRKLGQTKEGHLDESNQTKDLNGRRKKTANESTWKEVKGRQNFPPKVPVARKLVKNGQQERKQVSRVSLSARKSDMSTHSAEASPTSNKRKLESSEKRLSKNVPETGGSSSLFANGAGNLVNKRRKGARRKEQEEKEESNFSDLVNKYKLKLFGKDEGQTSVKRSRWFDD